MSVNGKMEKKHPFQDLLNCLMYPIEHGLEVILKMDIVTEEDRNMI